jgi:erythromycin esterase
MTRARHTPDMDARALLDLCGATLIISAALVSTTLLAAIPARAQADPGPPTAATTTDSARVEWLRQHAASIRTVDPLDEDFSDLAAIGRAIGDARVVFLGEPSHGTGNLFSAQARIAKYLHQHHGFDVLVFESGIYDASKTWQSILAGDSAHAAFRIGIPPVWSEPAEVRPIMDYVAANAGTDRPLEVAGYDTQFSQRASYQHLAHDLREWLESIGLADDFAADSILWNGLRRMHHLSAPATSFSALQAARPDSAAAAALLVRLHVLREAAASRNDDDRSRYWLQVLESAGVFARQVAMMKADPENWVPFWNVRDEQGGRNLVWLANERYAGRRLIVWLATIHAARNIGDVQSDDVDYTHVVPTGHHVWQALGREMYTLGMVALEGESGMGGETWPIVADQRPEFELEEMLGAAGFNTAFLDFREIPTGGEWLRGPLVSRPFGNGAMLAPSWPDVLDGLLFVRTGTPGTWPER